MFKVITSKVNLKISDRDVITSGQVNAYDVQFQFDELWDGLERIASFKAGKCGVPISIRLNDNNKVKIPWEVCINEYVGRQIFVGVCGMQGEELVIPTIWGTLGYLERGANLGDEPDEPTPSLYQQLLAETSRLRHHGYLEDRDDPDSHPIEAISGIDEITNLEVDYLWKGGMARGTKLRR